MAYAGIKKEVSPFWSTSKHTKCMCMFSAHHSNPEHQSSVDSCFQHDGSDLGPFLIESMQGQFTLQLWRITRPATAYILNFDQRLSKHKTSDTKLPKLLTEVVSKTFVEMPISPTKILIFVARAARRREAAHAQHRCAINKGEPPRKWTDENIC